MGGARAAADAALGRYLSDPSAARSQAQAALDQARADRDWATVGIAHRALGLVAGHLSHSGEAEDHLRQAIRFARRGGDDVGAARSRSDLAYVLSRQGRTSQAMRQIALAGPVLTGADAGRLLMMQALVLKVMGRRLDALAAYQQALPLIRPAGDVRLLAELLGNRGVIQMDLGMLDKAERDLREAAALFESTGGGLHAAITLHNLGCVAALRGDIPGAIATFDAAEESYAAHRDVPLELWRDRCEMLIAAGLAAEARAAAERAVAIAANRAESGELAEARVRLAQAALGEGDKATVEAESSAAIGTFVRQQRPAWAAFARWIRVRGRLLPPADRVSSVQVGRIQADLVDAGFTLTAVDAGLLMAQLAIREGRCDPARRELSRIGAGRSGPIWQRTQAWHARALLAQLDDDRSGVRRAARQALKMVADYRATLGATELQAVAAHRVTALAELGLRSAVQDGRPSLVLSWAERSRAAHLLTPVRPPTDPELANDLSALRLVTAQRLDAVRAGSSAQTDLIARQVALERAVRNRSRKLGGKGRHGIRTDRGDAPVRAVAGRDIIDRLDDRALVEFLCVDGELSAVTVVSGRMHWHPLGAASRIEHELQLVPFLLRRLARHYARPQSIEAALAALRRVSDVLDRQLMRPMSAVLGDRPLVLVAAWPLHGVLWSLFPTLRGRSVTVAPSAALWARCHDRASSADGDVVLAAGPNLKYADPEVDQLATLYPGATVLTGFDATVRKLLDAMDGAGLAHIAAHGHLRDDNPMFSDLVAHDGPLWVYDLETMRRAPHTVVISACQSGRTVDLPGGEVLGLASELLRMGVNTLIASMVDIADAQTAPAMVDLHGRMRTHGPAQALADMQARAFDAEPADLAVAAGFVCLGSG
jgi:tetratricopeptide (TPR) repeat protein